MRKFLTSFGLIISLLVVIVATNAQTAPERSGYILHLAEAGIITPLEEDTYLMMLTNTADFNAVVIIQPELFLFNYSLSDLVGDWETANRTETLTSTGTLDLNEFTVDIELTVVPSAYDMLGDTFSYEIRFTGELPESWVDKTGALLEEIAFERATLAIDVNETFTAGLRAGQQERLGSTRGGTANPPFP